ncbi:uncharacterized protein LOC121912543, partial [Scomber scombrus]
LLVRLPKPELDVDLPARPKTRALTTQRRKQTLPEMRQILQDTQDSDSSSDFEYYRLPRSNHASLENLEQKTQDMAQSSAVMQEDENASLQSDEIPEEDSSEEELPNADQELNQDSDPETGSDSEQED